MYTLKLSAEEIAALKIALCDAKCSLKMAPEVFVENLANVEILMQKAKEAEFTPEEG